MVCESWNVVEEMRKTCPEIIAPERLVQKLACMKQALGQTVVCLYGNRRSECPVEQNPPSATKQQEGPSTVPKPHPT